MEGALYSSSTTRIAQNAPRSSILPSTRTHPQPSPTLPLQAPPRPSTPDQLERPPPCPPPRLLHSPQPPLTLWQRRRPAPSFSKYCGHFSEEACCVVGPRSPRRRAGAFDLDWGERGGRGRGGCVAAWFVSERTREPVPLSRTHSPRVSEVPYLAPDFTFTSFSTPPTCPTPTPSPSPKPSSQIVTEDARALLVFSGCVALLSRQTRTQLTYPSSSLNPRLPSRGHTSPHTSTSEGESYLRFARTTGLLPPASAFPRAITEDAALDSYQNVLFSIARFRELTGVYPSRITVVGHNFKRRRFEQLHRLALRWPKVRFAYEGVPLRNEADEREAATGEVRSPSISPAYVLRVL